MYHIMKNDWKIQIGFLFFGSHALESSTPQLQIGAANIFLLYYGCRMMYYKNALNSSKCSSCLLWISSGSQVCIPCPSRLQQAGHANYFCFGSVSAKESSAASMTANPLPTGLRPFNCLGPHNLTLNMVFLLKHVSDWFQWGRTAAQWQRMLTLLCAESLTFNLHLILYD